MKNLIEDLNPPPRRLMGPGPVDVDPRILNAMSMPMLGQFDPRFTEYMNEVMALYRGVFRTDNHWTFLIDGTARAAIAWVPSPGSAETIFSRSMLQVIFAFVSSMMSPSRRTFFSPLPSFLPLTIVPCVEPRSSMT